AGLPPQSAMLYLLLAIDVSDASQEQNRMLNDFHRVANAPIFGWVDTYLGHGIVGGRLLSHQTATQRAGEVAARILDGAAPGDIKTLTGNLEMIAYDWRELQRWGISESRLPPGSLVEFREPSLWRQYLWPLSLILLAVLIQGAIISGL